MRWRGEPCERGAREGRGPAAGHGWDLGPLHRRRGSRVAALVSAPWAGSRSRARHVPRRALTGGDRGPGSPAGHGGGGGPARRSGDGICCGADAPGRCPATARTAAIDALGAGDLRTPDCRCPVSWCAPGMWYGASRIPSLICWLPAGWDWLRPIAWCSRMRQRASPAPCRRVARWCRWGEQGGMTTGSRAGCGTGAGSRSRWHRTGSIFICPPRSRQRPDDDDKSHAIQVPQDCPTLGEACSAE